MVRASRKLTKPVAKQTSDGTTAAVTKTAVHQNGTAEVEQSGKALPPASTDIKPSRKRARKTLTVPVKKIKLDFRHSRGTGHILTLGQGDTGQLGLGPDVMEKTRPALVSSVKDVVDVVAGGMHTVAINKDGEVFTFGCNDEGALGRTIEEEEECFTPGKVDIDGKVVLVSAGDSHTAALTEDGRVFAWGTFRDSSGAIGLTAADNKGIQKTPLQILKEVVVKKISSGSDHIVALTVNGEVYSFGNSEQGQLGRVPERFAHRGGRRGLDFLLTPDKLHVKTKSTVFKDVWAGSWNTVARTEKDEILVMGLNNYSQMGIDADKGLTFFMPTRSSRLEEMDLSTVSLGQHHMLVLDKSGTASALGRSEYGRLGLGEGTTDATDPIAIPALKGAKVVDIGCGTAVSFAVSEKGQCLSWGMGTNGQLGHGEEDDVWEPLVIKSKQVENRTVIAVSSGGQHTVLLAKDA